MSDNKLIEEAGKHVPYPATMDDAKWCIHCADEWPCVTRRLADALEAATSERAAVPDAAPDGQVIIPIARIHELRAAKDAALAAIGRVRAEASAYAKQPDVMEPCGAVAQSILLALDGAPEPEEKP